MHVNEVAHVTVGECCKQCIHGNVISGDVVANRSCLCLTTLLCRKEEKIIMATCSVNLEEFLVASCLGVLHGGSGREAVRGIRYPQLYTTIGFSF